jgi:rhodanese-related sulfurtransferase/DNA-binding HxlR family transcriptional regulator
MSSTGFKKELFAGLAQVGKVLGNGHRLELLEFLAQGERSVEGLARVAGLSVANASQHLQRLRHAGLVGARTQGHKVYYRLSDEDVVALMGLLRRIAERNSADVQRLVTSYLTVKDGLEPVPRKELLDRARQGLVTVLDVRPEEEYQAGHLPDAINVPLSRLEAQLKRLPKGQEIVAYCRGPHCVLAFEAVNRLRQAGYTARRLQDGYPEWKQAGLPVER